MHDKITGNAFFSFGQLLPLQVLVGKNGSIAHSSQPVQFEY